MTAVEERVGAAEEPAPPIRLLVAHRHRGFAEALGERLAEEADLEVVATCTDARQTGVVLSVVRPDVLLTDSRIGGPDGWQQVTRLRGMAPDVGVAVIAEEADPEDVVAALRVGVLGWVRTADPVERLCETIRGVARGEIWFPPALVTAAVRRLLDDGEERDHSRLLLDALTDREVQVLRHLVAGRSRSDIARDMFISPNTVRTHVNNVLHRLGVHDSVAAVAIARRAGLGPEPDPESPRLPQ